MKCLKLGLFEGHRYMSRYHSDGFNGEVGALCPVVKMNKTTNGFNLPTRPKGYDELGWA